MALGHGHGGKRDRSSPRIDPAPSVFTFAMDEILRHAVQSYNEPRKQLKWANVSKLLPGTTAKSCKVRWDQIKGFPGLEHMSFAVNQRIGKDRGGRAKDAKSESRGDSSAKSAAKMGAGR